MNFVDENDEVLISGFGRSGKAKGDIPGVRFKIVKVSGVGLLALWKEKKVRPVNMHLRSGKISFFFFLTGEAPILNVFLLLAVSLCDFPLAYFWSL